MASDFRLGNAPTEHSQLCARPNGGATWISLTLCTLLHRRPRLAGPIAPYDGASGASSMILFRTLNRAQADALAVDDRLVKAGILAYEILE